MLLAEEEIEANACDTEKSRKAFRLDVGDSRMAVALGMQLEKDLDLILQVANTFSDQILEKAKKKIKSYATTSGAKKLQLQPKKTQP
ncbi:unnamed protein product [Euphydryas editha]|uniref:Uncharacterized protein n=1 Tax=Euphydryas editha TaxID=104508 RepID=A0AAU9TV02_EUPED|nr:unnamed protein product [Euphydryas editha]